MTDTRDIAAQKRASLDSILRKAKADGITNACDTIWLVEECRRMLAVSERAMQRITNRGVIGYSMNIKSSRLARDMIEDAFESIGTSVAPGC